MTKQDEGGLTRRHFLELPAKVIAGSVLAGALGLPLEARATDPKAMEYFRKGLQLAEQGNYEEALISYKEGVRIDPKINKFPDFKVKKAGELYDLGFTFVLKDSNRAIDYFGQSIQLEPINPIPYHQRGRILAKKGNPREGVHDFKKAVSLQHNYSPAIGDLGRHLTALGEHEEAYFWNRLYMLMEPNPRLKAESAVYLNENKKILGIN